MVSKIDLFFYRLQLRDERVIFNKGRTPHEKNILKIGIVNFDDGLLRRFTRTHFASELVL